MKMLGFLFWFLFALSADAVACSCMGPVAPCEAYWQTPVIFAGTVTDISKVAANQKRLLSNRRVRFSVHEGYRGFTGSEVEVFTASSGAACGYGFTIGEQYLVYAYRRDDGSLYTGLCTRTQRLSDAADDLAYIRGLGSAAPGATIFGEVRGRIKSGDDEVKAVNGAKITVHGPAKSVDVTTDEKGRFRVTGLPAGTYKIKIVPPEGLNVNSDVREAKVVDRGCAQVDFWLQPDTRTGVWSRESGVASLESVKICF